MYKILCYGNSNTWGCIPGTDERYAKNQRWPGVMERELGDDYRIIEEGLNGRTTIWEDPIEGHKSEKNYLTPCLETHKPLNLVIIMLGTNNLKGRFSLPACNIAEEAGTLVKMVFKSETGKGKKPPPVGDLKEFVRWYEGAREKSKSLSTEFRRMAEELDCHLLNAGEYVSSSDTDGVHLEAEEHGKLGQVVARRVEKIRNGK